MKLFLRRLGSVLFILCFSVALPLLYHDLVEVAPVEAQTDTPPCEVMGVLVGLDGAVPIYDTPENGIVRLTLPIGQVVRSRGEGWHTGQRWCLVSPIQGAGSGWVPVAALLAMERGSPQVWNVRLCETEAEPTCEEARALDPAGFWLRWEYSGFHPEAQLQRVLVINGERYQTPLTIWSGERYGQQVVNLLEHRPRVEPGEWVVQFLVDGRLIEEARFEIE